MTRRIRTYADTGAAGGGDILAQVEAQGARVADRLGAIRHVVAVASGKGGVGKSLITANLAAALVRRGRRVGVLDADLNGPSVAAMLGAVRAPLPVTADGVRPAESAAGCVVMSMDLLLATPDAPVRWREPAVGGFVWQSTLETGALREFLADTAWGELDYLLIDLPPGTDRLARLFTLVPEPAALLLVTTPSAASVAVVARSATHARTHARTHAPTHAHEVPTRVGLVSNMDGYTCAACGSAAPLFRAGAGAALARETGLPLWGTVPFDPELGGATDAGRPLVVAQPDAPAARSLTALADTIERLVTGGAGDGTETERLVTGEDTEAQRPVTDGTGERTEAEQLVTDGGGERTEAEQLVTDGGGDGPAADDVVAESAR
jgi:ATP-binding protein involved in chromosome partitioning